VYEEDACATGIVGGIVGIFAGGLVGGLCAGAVSGLLTGPIRQDLAEPGYGNLYNLFFFMGLLVGAVVGYRVGARWERSSAAATLEYSQNLYSIPTLTEGLTSRHEERRAAAVRALTRLLPQLAADHQNLLTRHHRQNLYGMLTMRHAYQYPQFLLVLLKALEHVGDAAAIPYLTRLAESTVRYSPEVSEIVVAARTCRDALTARLEHERATSGLLRHAGPPEGADQGLLRPASTAAGTDPDSLLRPDDTEQADIRHSA
jgi:hypothetical protein